MKYLPTGSAEERPTLALSSVRALFGFPKVDAILVQTAVAQGLWAARGTTVSGVAFRCVSRMTPGALWPK